MKDLKSEENRVLHIQTFILMALFLVSGAAALIYEVLWVRQFSNLLGASTLAVTMVLGAYMTGLGLGAWWVGRMADDYKGKRLARLYMVLEIGIGIFALILPVLLEFSETFYIHLYRLGHPNPVVDSGIKFVFSFLLLLIPTTLIGATLPVLSRYVIYDKNRIGLDISRLYAVNSIGAILGTIVSGYALIPSFGLAKTNLIAVSLSFFVAIGICFISRQTKKEPYTSVESSSGNQGERSNPLVNYVILTGFCLSGVAAMFYEVSWTRTLQMILGTTTYAFTTMLATFILGIALGSWAYRFFRPSMSRLTIFMMLQFTIGLSVLLTIPAFEKMPFVFLSLHCNWVRTWIGAQLVRFLLSVTVMFLPTFAMGMVFPAVSAIFVKHMDHLGGRIGKAYAINTFGSAIGAVFGGLVMIPLIGMQKTIMAGAILNFFAATMVLLTLTRVNLRTRILATGGAWAVVMIILLFVQPWTPHIINSGTYIYSTRYKEMLDRYKIAALQDENIPQLSPWKIWELSMKQYRLLYYDTGVGATVAVMENNDGTRFLTINGKTDASTGSKSDLRTQTMIGHLPLFLNPKPEKVLVVGLGSGITTGAVLTHPVQDVDCVEISSAVIKAAHYFKESNHDVFNDHRVRILQEDARQWLLTSRKQYDVIISQPSNPWINGESSLFSLKWYQLAQSRLSEKGVFLQWLPTYLMAEQDLKVVIHTLRSVFGDISLWSSGSAGDLVLIARKHSYAIDYNQILKQNGIAAVRDDIEQVGLDPDRMLFQLFLMDNGELSQYLDKDIQEQPRINTDDLLVTEFSTPKHLFSEQKVSRFLKPDLLGRNSHGFIRLLKNIDKHTIKRLSDQDNAQLKKYTEMQVL